MGKHTLILVRIKIRWYSTLTILLLYLQAPDTTAAAATVTTKGAHPGSASRRKKQAAAADAPLSDDQIKLLKEIETDVEVYRMLFNDIQKIE